MRLTKEQIAKAAACKSVEELLALAKAEGLEMTAEEAEKYFAQLTDKPLGVDDIDAVSGGTGGCTGWACVDEYGYPTAC